MPSIKVETTNIKGASLNNIGIGKYTPFGIGIEYLYDHNQC
jgi:hypothetical protein